MSADTEDPLESLAQLVVRLRSAAGEERSAVVSRLLPLLSNEAIPIGVRVAAAGRAIEALPDTTPAVRPVAEALTAGQEPAPALQRLRHLQSLVEKCDALDALTDLAANQLRLNCPRCGAALPQPEMVKHLWHEHGLMLEDGKTRNLVRAAQAVRAEYATEADPAHFDRAAALAGDRVIGEWAAETASEEETLPLLAAAREREAGLCPACFAFVRPGVPALPPPLSLAHGRVAGDGHSATAASEFPPRVAASIAAGCVFLLFAALAPALRNLPFAPLWCTLLTAGAYFVTLWLRTPRGSPDDAAIDSAWRKLVPRLADQGREARFLTRLCLTSLGRGDPMDRANALQQVVARARARPGEVQLLAAAMTLRIDDGGRYGRDRAGGIAELVALAFQGEYPPEFAEHALAAYLGVPRETAERERFRILLIASAFASDLTPQAVIGFWDAAPHAAEAMKLPPHHLALLYGIWVNSTARPWSKIGEARTAFELASGARTRSGKLLADEPGLLLVCETDPEVEAALGRVLITTSGVSVGGVSVADPAADVLVRNDGWELILGKHALDLSRPVPVEFADELKAWLRFRAQLVATYPKAYLRRDTRSPSRLLAPFVVPCPSCGAQCLPVAGAVARHVGT